MAAGAAHVHLARRADPPPARDCSGRIPRSLHQRAAFLRTAYDSQACIQMNPFFIVDTTKAFKQACTDLQTTAKEHDFGVLAKSDGSSSGWQR